jgi:hypothetical protein
MAWILVGFTHWHVGDAVNLVLNCAFVVDACVESSEVIVVFRDNRFVCACEATALSCAVVADACIESSEVIVVFRDNRFVCACDATALMDVDSWEVMAAMVALAPTAILVMVCLHVNAALTTRSQSQLSQGDFCNGNYGKR